MTRIAATDPDAGVNARLLYSLVTSSTNDAGDRLFDVDSSTGTLTLVASLPSSTSMTVMTSPQLYYLDVAVSDSGQPPLTSVVQLTVELVTPTVGAAIQTGSGNVSLVLLLSVFGGALVVTLLLIIVAVVFVRRQRACCRRRSKSAAATGENGVPIDDQALAELYNDLSRSLDLVARTTLSRSRDLARSAATLAGGGTVYGGVVPSRSASMWFSSPDCSIATVPATPTTSSVYNCPVKKRLFAELECIRYDLLPNGVVNCLHELIVLSQQLREVFHGY
jgi:hypothetical protein